MKKWFSVMLALVLAVLIYTCAKSAPWGYACGGVASGEHGIGISKRSYFLRETAQENLAVMNTIKTALDPKHTLNDQKSYIVGGK